MENILDDKTNKWQAILKLCIAKDNLEGASQALSNYNQPKITEALSIVSDLLEQLKEESSEEPQELDDLEDTLSSFDE
mgnify:CR=1 FL=1|tara:strand:- start:1563 stop:1796 length:234 start_codon:yes stop_codon:yes gene_type:complete